MKQQEILEYNKRCAEFLTIKEELKNELSAYPLQEYSSLCSYANSAFISDKEDNPSNTVWDYCEFHSDWNWIMEVVNAINKTQNPRKSGDTTHSTLKREVQALLGKAAKEAVVQAINQFLIWYEQNKIT